MSFWANEADVIRQLEAAGLEPRGIELGRVVRCRAEGDRRNERSGWYVLRELTLSNGERLLVGSYGDWRSGAKHKIDLSGRKLSSEERAALRKKMAEDRKRAEAERKREAAEAARLALKRWQECSEAPPPGGCEYLTKKKVGAHGVRFTREGALVVPMMDVHGGIHGLQFILSGPGCRAKAERLGRNKQFWPSGSEKRGHFHMIGAPRRGGVVIVAEGYATAASIFEALGCEYPVAVAFDAGNLEPVARAICEHWHARIVIAGDDDWLARCPSCQKSTPQAERECRNCGTVHGKPNTGAEKANVAALAVDGVAVLPRFADRGMRKWTDFNDLAVHESPLAVAEQVRAAIARLPGSPAMEQGAGDARQGGGDEPPFIHLDEAIERYVIIRNVKDTMFDSKRRELVPRSCVLDYVTPDHAWRQWKTDPRRKNAFIEGVGFDPAGEDPNITCNLWRGWPTKPDSRGSCERLLELLEYMCSAEERPREVFQWVLRWLAYPIQHPGAKMKTALVVHGPQGVGKNLFFEAVMAIYGEYGRIIGQAEIEEKFNDWASRKLFLIANEVIARAELFHQKNKVKALITDDWVRINPKNVAAHEERNHMNLVFLSNELQPVVVEPDDRRFMVIWTPPKREPAFYRAVLDELRNGGSAALHHHLLHVDLGDFHPGTPPMETRARRHLIEISKESPDRFCDEWLAGELEHPVTACALADLYEAYVRWSRRVGERFAYPLNKFSARISAREDLSIEKKPVLQASGKPKVMRVVLPQSDQKPDGETWQRWLPGRIEEFAESLTRNGGEF